ncbi:PcfJ domain-containing protein [Luteolibacter flavescens]|uniref:PcfJ domain-containing protein n=1 Tax=Luteolibacter flavescens TaxID=1859460 RepID=A0ABT3FM76_9BACT|nr:PcfJ domain-containing protein [Luteolibacter flavescens]MCW1884682.1 PcfJ domain-containing protein [Luteolibacter flavescens]
MPSSRSRSGGDFAILAGIIAGEPWIASHFRNPSIFKHGRAFGRMFHTPRKVTAPLRDPCLRLVHALAERSHLLDRPHGLSGDLVPMLSRVAAYAGRWLRGPESWRPPSGLSPEESWSDLLRHLFAEWPLPAFFDSAWRVRGELWAPERDWFCHLARGGSWRKAAGFPMSISGRAIHLAMQAPETMTVRQALWRGLLVSLDASPALIDAVLAHDFIRERDHDDVWTRLLAKVAGARGFDPRAFGVIADVILELLHHDHVKRACLLVALPLGDLMRHAFGRWQSLLDAALMEGIRFRDHDLTRASLRADLRAMTDAAWAPMPDAEPYEIVCAMGTEQPSVWTFRERLSHAQLMAEGRELRHCVAGYWHRCQTGRSAIFSLRQHQPAISGFRHVARLTIEVDRVSRRIIQARGKQNRWPEEFEYQLLTRWANARSLVLAV